MIVGEIHDAPTVVSMPPGGRAATPLALLFMATGFVGLISEQVYEKMLGTLVGASTPAAAMVLAAYFTGLTFGALSYERLVKRRLGNPIRTYAWIEGSVALLLIATAAFFDALIPWFTPLLASAHHNFALLQLARLGVAALWILPPVFLMGASLPAISDAIVTMRLPNRHRSLTFFYALNLAGALIASALGPYVVFPLFGLDGALTLCAAIGGAVCLTALRIARRHARDVVDAPEQAHPIESDGSSRTRLLILTLAFASGFLFFALEVIWIHLLAVVIGNSVFAFATMLTVVLLGLGAGSAALTAAGPRDGRTSWGWIGAIMAAGGVAIALTHPLWPAVPHSLATIGSGIRSFGAAELLRFAHAFVLVAPPAAILGMLLPALFRLRGFPSEQLGGFVGRTTAANAIGCAIGALLTSFFLLPLFGSEKLLAAFAIVLAIAGALLIVVAKWRFRSLALAAPVLVAVLVLTTSWNRLALTSGEHVYFRETHVGPASKLRFFHEDAGGGMTTVVGNRSDDGHEVRVLLTNGKFQGNDGGERNAQIAFAAVPALFINNFDDALVIGLGTGATANSVRHLGFGRIRIAEIAEGIVHAAREQFGELNGSVLDAGNVRLQLEDGRNLLLIDRDARYDLITMEISSIWFANSTNLYSTEFYQLAKSRLKPGGVMQQWIQMHHIDAYDVAATIATMRAVFPYVSFWSAGGQGILVGTDRPQVITRAGVEHVRPLIKPLLPNDIPWQAGIREIASAQLLSPPSVDQMIQKVDGLVINTDRNRFLEYSTPRYNLNHELTQERMEQRLRQYSDGRRPPLEHGAAALLRDIVPPS